MRGGCMVREEENEEDRKSVREWEEMVDGVRVPQSFTLFSANIAWRCWNISQTYVSDTMLFYFEVSVEELDSVW